MMYLALALLHDAGEAQERIPMAMFAFLSIGAFALFGIFLPVTVWLENRRKEREAYYRAEMMRRLAESSGEGAKAAIELLREEEHMRHAKKLDGMKIGGLVNIAVGVGLGAMLWSVAGQSGGPYLVGLIPMLIGVALLIYVFFMADPF
jgi:hypothetical protein